MSAGQTWQPLAADTIAEIRRRFAQILPTPAYGDLADRIGDYWAAMLERVWESKDPRTREKDLGHLPADPLSRIGQRTLLIAYADSVQRPGEKTLVTLRDFLRRFFPAIRGMHMLPACEVAEDRFNDGYFSQVVRNRVHGRFGTGEQLSCLMQDYFSMADFVLNHVDIGNPRFQAYLQGDEQAGRAFFVFTEQPYRDHLAAGDFARVFRPRPFPLFTIFRAAPREPAIAAMSLEQRFQEMERRLGEQAPPRGVLGILYLFNKVKNDQMLLEEDYGHILRFRQYLLEKTAVDPQGLFTLSETQEVRHPPYIFRGEIQSRADLLRAIGLEAELAERYARYDEEVFGREIRALTTFSHVQVDLNTSTFEGLKMLAEDFSWYLSMDLNLLRLDAANYAFKEWKSSCYRLPQVTHLMKILYLSMEAVSPRIVPNLEVNDRLGAILEQMADPQAPPPMMYDFHLAGILPLVFNSGSARPLARIFELIGRYSIPRTSIRFSLAESHDGKSVRGSMDLLTLAERQSLVDATEAGGGKIKYKSVPAGEVSLSELSEVCSQVGIDAGRARSLLLDSLSGGTGRLKSELRKEQDIVAALGLTKEQAGLAAVRFLLSKVVNGREPYELCCSTRDCLPPLEDEDLEARRYLAFYTLAFALMGRNVKSVYFNDLLALPNDYDRMSRSGELRDLKRTRSDYDRLAALIADPGTFEHRIARGMNDLIALVDSDPALGPRGNEAEIAPAVRESTPQAVALVHCSCAADHTLVAVNVLGESQELLVDTAALLLEGGAALYDNIAGREVPTDENGLVALKAVPFQALWLTAGKIPVDRKLLFRARPTALGPGFRR
jgi:hypothetical protein